MLSTRSASVLLKLSYNDALFYAATGSTRFSSSTFSAATAGARSLIGGLVDGTEGISRISSSWSWASISSSSASAAASSLLVQDSPGKVQRKLHCKVLLPPKIRIPSRKYKAQEMLLKNLRLPNIDWTCSSYSFASAVSDINCSTASRGSSCGGQGATLAADFTQTTSTLTSPSTNSNNLHLHYLLQLAQGSVAFLKRIKEMFLSGGTFNICQLEGTRY